MRRDVAITGLVALILGLAYCIVTPPGQVPDEWGHFLRAVAIAEGDPFPEKGPDLEPGHHFAKGFQMFRYRLARSEPESTFRIDDLRAARAETLDREHKAGMLFPAWYTPVPYLPQAFAAYIGIHLNARPFTIFYLGRFANLFVSILILVFAASLLPRGSAVPIAVMLTPMAMFELASWSADAMTIAASALLTCLIIRNIQREDAANVHELTLLVGAPLLVGLCKPAYFLLVLVSMAIPVSRFGTSRRKAAVVTAMATSMATGTVLSILAAHAGQFRQRFPLPVDPTQQMACVRANPIRFLSVFLTDLRDHGLGYLEQAAGRLGLMDIKLPALVIIATWVLLLWAAVTSGVQWKRRDRLGAIAVCILTLAGISLTQYLVWSIICGETIEGIQGRYYLPFLPALLFAFSAPRVARKASLPPLVASAVIVNAVAIGVLFTRYWR